MNSIAIDGTTDDAAKALEQLIEKYFHGGLTYEEMCLFLDRRHGIRLTIHQLKRRLKFLGLRWRNATVSLEEVEDAILAEKLHVGRTWDVEQCGKDSTKNIAFRFPEMS
eukprot:m.115906 g.115906  ORF g.115906 m.115906 type:complete len:109 (+) comp37571_c0_seq12:124-450(+)